MTYKTDKTKMVSNTNLNAKYFKTKSFGFMKKKRKRNITKACNKI